MSTDKLLTSRPDQDSEFCSELSMGAGESLFGSATRTQVYLLLEYSGAWGAKAIPESGLPEAVKARLTGLAKELPYCKALLIRSDRRREAPGFTFIVAKIEESQPALYAFQLAQYEDLLDLDIPATLAGGRQFEARRLDQSLYLVCTNGRRDKCCAKFGLPVYQALDQLVGEAPIPVVWQSSHVGGHRFAVNMTCLPHGLLYGRVNPANAAAILAADQQGHIHLPNLRGRACYDEAAQAAEALLREQSGETAVDAYRLQEIEAPAPDHWRVTFRQDAPSGAVIHQVGLQLHVSDRQVYAGCTLDKLSAIKRYALIDHQRLSNPRENKF